MILSTVKQELPLVLETIINFYYAFIFPCWKILLNWLIGIVFAGLTIEILPKLFLKDIKFSMWKYIIKLIKKHR